MPFRLGQDSRDRTQFSCARSAILQEKAVLLSWFCDLRSASSLSRDSLVYQRIQRKKHKHRFLFLRAFFFLRRWWNNLPFPPSLLSEVVEQPPFSPFLYYPRVQKERLEKHTFTQTPCGKIVYMYTTYSSCSNTFLYTSLDFGRHGSL